MPIVALVTCFNIPEPDPDESILIDACKAAGLQVELVPWEDRKVEWERFDLVVLRSTWNYYEDEIGFRSWIEEVSARTSLWNGKDLVLWNLDKHYLSELSGLGISTVPTRYIDLAEGLGQILDDEGWDDFVVKPTVSAGSFMTQRFSRNELSEAEAFVASIQKTHSAMVQKYMSCVADGGEVALIHIDGELTHGLVKHPRFDGDDESVSEAIVPSCEQAAMAKLVMGAVSEPWLYGRIDLMLADDGHWLLSELELVEPSLFFRQSKFALDRFVSALVRLVAQ